MDSFFRWFGLPGALVLTVLLSCFALTRALIDPSAARWACFAAMALSSVGDVFLARPKKLRQIVNNCFPIGAGFFMASHAMYILCYGIKIHTAGISFWNAGTAFAAVIGIVALSTLLRLSIAHSTRKVLPLVLVYLMIILVNCSTVFSYAWAQGVRYVPAVCAAIGVVSFMLSDFVIALNLTAKIHRYDALVWWLYPIGQILLILGA